VPNEPVDRRQQAIDEAALQRIEALMATSSPKQAIRSAALPASEVAGDPVKVQWPQGSAKTP